VERRVVLLGFTEFERHQLHTVLRLASARSVRYRPVEQPAEAEFAVADADDAAAVAVVRARGLAAVLVGSHQPGGPARLPRPINVAQVVRALDALARRGPAPTAPVQRVLDELAHVAGLPPKQPRGRVLLAAADSAATRSLVAPLQRAGCELVQARSAAQAIERARGGGFQLVVIDAAIDGLDGYHACRTIKRRAEADALGRGGGGGVPAVALIAATGAAAVGRVRAELAGADLLLEPPLDAAALLALLPEAAPA
jgi:two-component system, cell cycle response regulator